MQQNLEKCNALMLPMKEKTTKFLLANQAKTMFNSSCSLSGWFYPLKIFHNWHIHQFLPLPLLDSKCHYFLVCSLSYKITSLCLSPLHSHTAIWVTIQTRTSNFVTFLLKNLSAPYHWPLNVVRNHWKI